LVARAFNDIVLAVDIIRLRLRYNVKKSRKPRLTAVGIRCRGPRSTLYPQKLSLTSPTIGGRSVGIVRLRTKATEFSLFIYLFLQYNEEFEQLIDVDGCGRCLPNLIRLKRLKHRSREPMIWPASEQGLKYLVCEIGVISTNTSVMQSVVNTG
jgi:hypothetical protein